MKWSDAKVSAEITSGGKVFAPVEMLTENGFGIGGGDIVLLS